MKNFIEERKKDIARTIAENPTKIIINRTIKVPKGGGRSIEKSVLGPFLIRIFNQKSKAFQVNVSNTVAGVKQTDSTYAFLATDNVDIKCTPNITDEFKVYGQRFRVISVIPRYIQGVLTSVDGGLEVIS